MSSTATSPQAADDNSDNQLHQGANNEPWNTGNTVACALFGTWALFVGLVSTLVLIWLYYVCGKSTRKL